MRKVSENKREIYIYIYISTGRRQEYRDVKKIKKKRSNERN